MPKFNKVPFQQLLAQGETSTAIAELLKISSSIRPPSLQTEVAHLSARWNDYERQHRMGTADAEQLGLTKRQIDQSFLQLLERIETVAASPNKRNWRALWIGLGSVVALLSGLVTIVGVDLSELFQAQTPTTVQDTLPTIDTAEQTLNPDTTPQSEKPKTTSNRTSTPATSPEVIVQQNPQSPDVEIFEHGKIDWRNGFIEATGIAIINNEKYTNNTQAIEMAKIGAKRVAQANILDIIEAVKVTRTTTVQDFMTTSDVIKSQIEGTIRGSRVVGEATVKKDHVAITVRMPLYADRGLASILLTEIQKNPASFQSFDLQDTTGTSFQLLKRQ